MKKIIATTAALAIVLTGAPHAAAFSSMSSSSPAISQPEPEPTTPKPAPVDPNEVYTAIYSGHTTAMKKRGYTWNESSRELMRIYSGLDPVTQAYQKAEIEANGYTVTVVDHNTKDFRKDYEDLMATPTEPKKYELFGIHVVYGAETTKAYIFNS